MEKARDKIKETLGLVGFDSLIVELAETEGRITVSIKDRAIAPDRVPELVDALTHLARQIGKKEGAEYVVVDINDYRKDREALIVKLARAAAKKAAVTGDIIPLPAMNAYERRIVHAELSMRPDVQTESTGEDKERHVVVKPTTL